MTLYIKKNTLNPNSPAFSASKSYNAVQYGFCEGGMGVLAGDFMGEGNGDAETFFTQLK